MEKEMKTLLLLRHAKSSKEDPGLRDFDRPLNERGVMDARLVGDFIRQQKIQPDLIISSPAERARQTADLVLKAAGLKIELGAETWSKVGVEAGNLKWFMAPKELRPD